MQGALESIKRGQLPQSVKSPVVNPQEVKQASLPKKKPEWKVQIDDGSTIVFDSEPTQQDIEEAYAQVQGMKKPEPESPIGKSFLPQSTTQAINRLKEAPKVYQDIV